MPKAIVHCYVMLVNNLTQPDCKVLPTFLFSIFYIKMPYVHIVPLTLINMNKMIVNSHFVHVLCSRSHY